MTESEPNEAQLQAEETVSYFRTKFLIYATIHAVLFYYWMAFPVSNMVFENTGPQLPVDYRYGLNWFAVALVLLNGAVPAVTGISNMSTGCNAVGYCRAFATQVSSDCPSVFPCVPAPSLPLYWTSEWAQHTWITLGFLILLLFQWAENSDIRTTGVVKADEKSGQESLVISLVLLFAMALAFYWFQGFIVPNLQFIHGYPAFDALAPGPFLSNHYNLQWIAVHLLNVNLLPLLLMAAALFGQVRQEVLQKLHLRVTSYVVAVLNLLILAYWVFVLVFNTNDPPVFPSPGSISNGDDYCCERFAEHPEYCANTIPCTGSHYPIAVNPVFVKLIGATLLFCVTTTVHYIMNARFIQYGTIKSSD